MKAHFERFRLTAIVLLAIFAFSGCSVSKKDPNTQAGSLLTLNGGGIVDQNTQVAAGSGSINYSSATSQQINFVYSYRGTGTPWVALVAVGAPTVVLSSILLPNTYLYIPGNLIPGQYELVLFDSTAASPPAVSTSQTFQLPVVQVLSTTGGNNGGNNSATPTPTNTPVPGHITPTPTFTFTPTPTNTPEVNTSGGGNGGSNNGSSNSGVAFSGKVESLNSLEHIVYWINKDPASGVSSNVTLFNHTTRSISSLKLGNTLPSFLSADFSECGTVAVNASCVVEMTFDPSAAGASTSNVGVSYKDSAGVAHTDYFQLDATAYVYTAPQNLASSFTKSISRYTMSANQTMARYAASMPAGDAIDSTAEVIKLMPNMNGTGCSTPLEEYQLTYIVNGASKTLYSYFAQVGILSIADNASVTPVDDGALGYLCNAQTVDTAQGSVTLTKAWYSYKAVHTVGGQSYYDRRITSSASAPAGYSLDHFLGYGD